MSAQNWTKAQRGAIELRGGSILVGAAAGSGKTSVLVERIVRAYEGPPREVRELDARRERDQQRERDPRNTREPRRGGDDARREGDRR